MSDQPSKTQINRLGERLRDQQITADDIRLLDEYRRSFVSAYEIVVDALRKLDLRPTGRPAKTTPSIIEKLRRQPTNLARIQDIAGCRVIVSTILEQDKIVESIRQLFDSTRVVDRRLKPSSGYRAVHLIPVCNGKSIEIQVRTKLQHLWAELSEKLADDFDPAVKYGGGPQNVVGLLERVTTMIAAIESAERNVTDEESMERVGLLRQDLENLLTESIEEYGK